MRYLRLLHAVFLLVLFTLDLLLIPVFDIIIPLPFYFVPRLTLIGLLILVPFESYRQNMVKGFIYALLLDLNHVSSFPVFYFMLLFVISFAYLWKRQLAGNIYEMAVVVVVSLFVSEISMYFALIFLKDLNLTFTTFLSERLFWTVSINALLFPIVHAIYRRINGFILSKTQA